MPIAAIAVAVAAAVIVIAVHWITYRSSCSPNIYIVDIYIHTKLYYTILHHVLAGRMPFTILHHVLAERMPLGCI